MWRNGNKYGLRKKENISKAKELIMNLKVLNNNK